MHNAETVLLIGNTCLLGTDDLLAIDIEDPCHPRVTACVRHAEISDINGMVRWRAHILAANKRGFVDLFDVTDPREPHYVGALNTRKHGHLQWPHDIARYGREFVVLPGAGRNVPVHFAIYKVSDDGVELRPIEKWKFVGGVSSNLLAGANRVVCGANCAYVVCHYSNRLGVISLSDPQGPELVAHAPTAGYEPDGLTIRVVSDRQRA